MHFMKQLEYAVSPSVADGTCAWCDAPCTLLLCGVQAHGWIMLGTLQRLKPKVKPDAWRLQPHMSLVIADAIAVFAVNLYETAKAMPSSTTRSRIVNQLHISLNGES